MLCRFISAVLFIFAIIVFSFSSNPADPIFALVSNNLVVNALRITLAGGLLAISIKSCITNPHLRIVMKVMGVALMTFGFASILNMRLESAVYAYVKPLDLLVAAQLGIAMSLLALTAPETMTEKESSFSSVAKAYFLRPKNS